MAFVFRLDNGRYAGRATNANKRGANWRAGDSIPLGKRTLRVVGMRDDDADKPPVLIVEEWPSGP
jgi:hypothetical protein